MLMFEMPERTPHERCVDAWLAGHVDPDDQTGQSAELLVVGLRAVWDRARPSLGEQALTAIFERVLQTARRRYPELARLELRVNDRPSLVMDSPYALALERPDAVAFILVEVLAVVGHLTAGTLTPGLHAALSADNVHAQENTAP